MPRRESGRSRSTARSPVLGDHEDKAVSGGRLYSNKAPGLALRGLSRSTARCAPSSRCRAAAVGRRLRAGSRLLTVSLVCVLALAPVPSGRLAERRRRRRPLVGLRRGARHAVSLLRALLLRHAWDGRAALSRLGPRGRGARRAAGAARRGAARSRGFSPAGRRSPSTPSRRSRSLLVAARSRRPIGAPARCRSPRGAPCRSPLLSFTTRPASARRGCCRPRARPTAEYAALAGAGVFGFGAAEPASRSHTSSIRRAACCSSRRFWLWSSPGSRAGGGCGGDRADWWLRRWPRSRCFFVCLCGYPNWHGGWSLGSRYLLPARLLRGAADRAGARDAALARALPAAAVFSVRPRAADRGWPHFPLEMPWPRPRDRSGFSRAAGSRRTSARCSGAAALCRSLLPAAADGLGGLATPARRRPRGPPWRSRRSHRRSRRSPRCSAPARAVPYFGRLWRAGVFGAFSGSRPGAARSSAPSCSRPRRPRRSGCAVRRVALARAPPRALLRADLEDVPARDPAAAAADRALRVEEQAERARAARSSTPGSSAPAPPKS